MNTVASRPERLLRASNGLSPCRCLLLLLETQSLYNKSNTTYDGKSHRGAIRASKILLLLPFLFVHLFVLGFVFKGEIEGKAQRFPISAQSPHVWRLPGDTGSPPAPAPRGPWLRLRSPRWHATVRALGAAPSVGLDRWMMAGVHPGGLTVLSQRWVPPPSVSSSHPLGPSHPPIFLLSPWLCLFQKVTELQSYWMQPFPGGLFDLVVCILGSSVFSRLMALSFYC